MDSIKEPGDVEKDDAEQKDLQNYNQDDENMIKTTKDQKDNLTADKYIIIS